jgi:ribosomal protein S6
MSRLYETMYILRPDLNEHNLEAAIAKLTKNLNVQLPKNIRVLLVERQASITG